MLLKSLYLVTIIYNSNSKVIYIYNYKLAPIKYNKFLIILYKGHKAYLLSLVLINKVLIY